MKNANLLYVGRAFYVQFLDESREDLVFAYETPAQIYSTVNEMLEVISAEGINIVNKESYKFFNEKLDENRQLNESMTSEEEALLEFEMFDVKRRDVVSFADFLKNAANYNKVTPSGKDLQNRKFELGFMHEIQRDPLFKHPAFDNLYKSWGERDPEKRKEQEGGNYTTPGAFPAGVGGF
jgi:hypothetical protein